MERIVLRHLNGSKANQVEEFPLTHFKELIVGRDPSATVKYDPDKDDTVGREHARISQDRIDPAQFTITDLNSRNGTFVNKQRVFGSTRIGPGDVIQFGAGGPEFQFDIEPRPANAIRPTRVDNSSAVTLSSAPPTRVGSSAPGAAAAGSPDVQKTAVGKATVERMISQTKSESHKRLYIAVAAVVLVIAAVATGLFYKSRMDARLAAQQGQKTSEELAKLGGGLGEVKEKTSAMTPGQVSAQYTPATVFIQASWTLLDNRNGSPLFHRYVPNQYKDKDGKIKPIVPDGRPYVAAYASVPSQQGNKIEPVLTTDSNALGLPIGNSLTGSGFCVTSDGFILTNLHVAASWRIFYHFPQNLAFPGALFDSTGRPLIGQDGSPTLVNQLMWIPADTQQFGGSDLGHPAVEGRNDSLYVTFANSELRIPAKLARVSDRHDTAMLKIDLPEPVKKVELNDNYDTIKTGDPAIVLGYPGGSPPQVAIIKYKAKADWYQQPQVGVIPTPTLSVGYISRVLREQEGTGGKDIVISTFGDIYQLTINTTGGGNSGGPVFDDRGRVVAIYTYGLGGDFQASGAVPIKYAKELMGVTSVVK